MKLVVAFANFQGGKIDPRFFRPLKNILAARGQDFGTGLLAIEMYIHFGCSQPFAQQGTDPSLLDRYNDWHAGLPSPPRRRFMRKRGELQLVVFGHFGDAETAMGDADPPAHWVTEVRDLLVQEVRACAKKFKGVDFDHEGFAAWLETQNVQLAMMPEDQI